jgi:NCAIR mutase (PurE)-related protein
MNEEALKKLLDAVSQGKLGVEEALSNLKDFEYKDLGFAKIDNHRSIRTGYPEVIFCQGKTPDQVAGIINYMNSHDHNILATRANIETYYKVREICPEAEYHEIAKVITVKKKVAEETKLI